jgi:hypothetical protein
MVHYAKVDWWLAALMVVIVFAELAAGTVVLVGGLSTDELHRATNLIVGPILLAAGVFFGLMLWGCYRIRYDVTAADLIVRFGPFRSTIPLTDITEVFPTNNPLSAPAPSLDRLRVDYRKKNGKMWFVLISPRDKEGFVRDLAGAAPQLRSVGGEPLRLKAEGSP